MITERVSKGLSKDQAAERELIIFKRNFDSDLYKYGGIVHFDKIDLSQVNELVKKGYLDLEETQNDSPTTAEFMEFVEYSDDPNNWYFHGYAVSPDRSDCRVTIEGIGSKDDVTPEDIVMFSRMCRFADDFQVGLDGCYCWFD